MEHVNCIKFAAHLVFRKIMTTLLASQPLYIKIIGPALVSSLRRSNVLLFVNILFLRIFCSFWKYTYNNSIFVLQIISKPVELFFVYRKQGERTNVYEYVDHCSILFKRSYPILFWDKLKSIRYKFFCNLLDLLLKCNNNCHAYKN